MTLVVFLFAAAVLSGVSALLLFAMDNWMAAGWALTTGIAQVALAYAHRVLRAMLAARTVTDVHVRQAAR